MVCCSNIRYIYYLFLILFDNVQSISYLFASRQTYGYVPPYEPTIRVDSIIKCVLHCIRQEKCTAVCYNIHDNRCNVPILYLVSPSSQNSGWICYLFEGPENQINVAMSKNVTMSSLWYLPIHHAGSYAVDGQVLNSPGADKCATTQPEVKPWLLIDLGNTYDIDRVVIYNRQDTLGERLYNVEVTVSQIGLAFPTMCGFFGGPGDTGQTIYVFCTKGSRGRYVRLQIIGQIGSGNMLTLCEVEVYILG